MASIQSAAPGPGRVRERQARRAITATKMCARGSRRSAGRPPPAPCRRRNRRTACRRRRGSAASSPRARGPAPVQFAEPPIAISVRMSLDVLVPQDLQRNVLALQLTVDRRPVRLRAPAMTRLFPRPGKELLSSAASVNSAGNGQSRSGGDDRSASPAPSRPPRRAGGHLVAGCPVSISRISRAHDASRPLRWHRTSPQKQRSGP